MGKGKGPAKGSKGGDSTRDQDTPFFTVALKTLPLKGERKARIRARTKVDIKARAKAKVRTKKVD